LVEQEGATAPDQVATTEPVRSGALTEWMDWQQDGVRHYATLTLWNMLRSFLQRTVDQYPWKDKAGMVQRMPTLLLRAVHAVEHGEHCPLADKNVDCILPRNIEVDGLQSRDILNDVRRVLQREPSTLLEVYDSVFVLVHNRELASHASRMLYRRLFV
jgi:hypothetical protein